MSRIVTGLVLIGLGIVFLLERLDMIAFHTIARYWPLALVVLGLGRLFSWRTRPIGFSVTLILLGFWFLAVVNGFHGLTWHYGWPMIIVIVGVGVIVEALLPADELPGPERRQDDV